MIAKVFINYVRSGMRSRANYFRPYSVNNVKVYLLQFPTPKRARHFS
jgi:hypothetical protein